MLGASIASAGLALGGCSASVEATEYSAYDDPEKPAITFMLAEERNVEQFRERCGLSDGEVEVVLAAVRKENEALARQYGESGRIEEANEALTADRAENKIAASYYDEKVRAAVAETQASIKALLPEDRRPDLIGVGRREVHPGGAEAR